MKKSLGNISALAALCATCGSSSAAVVAATGINNNVIVSPGANPFDIVDVSFDVDGDGQADLGFLANSGNMQLLQAGTTASYYVLTATGSGLAQSLTPGQLIDPFIAPTGIGAAVSLNGGYSVLQAGTVYLGFAFETTGATIHAGFMELEVTLDGSNGGVYDQSGDSVTLVSASWETLSNTSITVIPEPSTSLAALSGLAGLALLRRRRH